MTRVMLCFWQVSLQTKCGLWTMTARQRLRDFILRSNLDLKGIVALLDSDRDGVVSPEDLQGALKRAGLSTSDYQARLMLRSSAGGENNNVNVYKFVLRLGAAPPNADSAMGKQLDAVRALLTRSGVGLSDLFQVPPPPLPPSLPQLSSLPHSARNVYISRREIFSQSAGLVTLPIPACPSGADCCRQTDRRSLVPKGTVL